MRDWPKDGRRGRCGGDWHCEVPGCIQKVKELGEEALYPSVVGMPNAYLGTAWLETDFEVPELTDGRQLWLKCGGIAPAAHLWVNGTYVGYHAYAPVSAKWNITGMVRSGQSARVTAAIVEEDIGLLGGLRFGEVFWSGLYRSVEIETAGAVRIEELWLRPDAANGRLAVSGCIYNDSAAPALLAPAASVAAWREEETASASGNAWTASGEAVEVGPGGSAAFALTVDMPDADRWSCEAPALYLASVALNDGTRPVDVRKERFGLRDLSAEGSALKLNGRPFLARGTGQEYFSPTISPLTDRAIIRQRWTSLREHGFNFFRCHTYTPTPEELEIADELGILLASEIGLVSNFGGTFPFAEAADVLAAHVVQTRNHPSLAVYCLGNEGSQLMVHRQEDRERAETGYRIIKRHAPDHIGMIAFGMQGELPDLPNDAESPHLWGHEFRLAYDGLSRIPWRLPGPSGVGGSRRSCTNTASSAFGPIRGRRRSTRRTGTPPRSGNEAARRWLPPAWRSWRMPSSGAPERSAGFARARPSRWRGGSPAWTATSCGRFSATATAMPDSRTTWACEAMQTRRSIAKAAMRRWPCSSTGITKGARCEAELGFRSVSICLIIQVEMSAPPRSNGAWPPATGRSCWPVASKGSAARTARTVR
ncbi:glycoside hydrolase family 2 protein [Cohnella rhizosphaerae]|uniref:Beta-galactosidase n=1 Tax=Cohnella rhizosphaerae TaxID=1457232 RepID=A0A9X4QRV3_9BACL|nr:sugar-binding domain-containing protein [Cohnella rhizosphaerae]MDG0808634.1 hypothetical protein [Cohnella rhizosphaerae]